MMPSSDERTRRMEVVASKMRTLAVAARPLLDEFAISSSPGHRLAATTILQVTPDHRYLDWLSQRFAVDTPFLSYHAGVALLTAARLASEEHRQEVLTAIRIAKQHLGNAREGGDRMRILESAEQELTIS